MAGEIGLRVVGKMAELMIEPIQRELGYLLCFNSNFQELEAKLDELKATRNDVQAREGAAKRMRHTLGEAAMKWIENANGEIEKAETVLNDKAELQKGCFSVKWCPNLSLRFSLSRKGKKSSLVLVELLQSGSQLPTTGHALPMPSINMRDYIGDARDFDSRSQIMEDIIEMLKDDETMLIGICGMGGIGKTTFAKQLLQKVHDSHKHLFEIQVFTTVSSTPNFNAIQQEVAEMLGSSLKDFEGKTLRAELLRKAFSNKKVVVLLDDVWEKFDLDAFGFPLTKSNVGCCKIIYTSRNHGLWPGQGTITKKEIGLELLSPEEAFNLFEREVGLRYDDMDFHWKNEIARQIVEECGRLPLALGVVGGALIEEIEKHAWEHMLYQLRNHGQDQITKKINKVLKTSYHFLKDPNDRSLFLLGCLFGEDQIIPVETLYRYALSLQLFKGRNDLKPTRDHVYTIVDNLIRRNLLIKSETLYRRERAVKMHDLVREVGILIAEQEKNGIHFLKWDGVNELENIVTPHTKMIHILSQKKDLQVLDTIEFRGSKLELLRFYSTSIGSNIKILGNYLFQGEDNFKVLDIQGFYGIISELPLFSGFYGRISELPLFSPLTKLQMLSFEGMSLDMTTNISSIGHIKFLKILSLKGSIIKVLPNEISELTNLRLLDLTRCNCFIGNGVFLKLINLQELYMWESFQEWRLQNEAVNSGDNHAAGLDELNFLPRLWRLEVEVPNIEQVPRGVRLFSSSMLLEQFKIRIGEGKKSNAKFESGKRQLILKNDRDNTSFLHELGVLIEKGITDLYLCADSGMCEKINTNQFISLKYIELRECGSLFPPSPSSLQTSELGRFLRRIKLYECNEMTYLCSTSISRNLTNLQVLVLQKCNMTEEVVSICDEIEQLNKIEFNTLKTLILCDLSRLEYFCKGIEEVHFQNLKTLELIELKEFTFTTKLEIPCLEELSMISIPKFETLCNIVSPLLQKLYIDNCDNFQYFDFSDSMVMKMISNLKSLTIKRCKRLKGVAGITVGAREQRRKSIEFPILSTLEVGSLDEIASFVIDVNNLGDKEEKSKTALFYHDNYQVSFPCLEELIIEKLSNINYIIGKKEILDKDDKEIQPLILFPNLKTLKLVDLVELLSYVGVMNNMDNNCKNENALFHPEDNEFSFPCLERLTIDDLSKINYIIGWKDGGSLGEGRHHHDQIFHVLRELILIELGNLIHMYEINQPGLGVLLFQNLIFMEVGGCKKLRYLFSENIGKTATKQLKKLDIYSCEMMEVVMKKDEELLIEDDDDKARESNFLRNTHLFPLLETMKLKFLRGLRSFSDVAYNWALPSLEDLEVLVCPKLEALSPGYLDSPMLERLYYDIIISSFDMVDETINVKNTWKGDVNGAFRHLFIIKTQKKEAQSVERLENLDEEDDEE